MKLRQLALMAASLALAPPLAMAQPADLPIPAARTTEYPPGVSVRQTKSGPVYAARGGRTLYGMDMRTVLRWSADASQYCKDRCEDWEPLLAPQGAAVNIAFPRGGGRQPPLPQGFVAPQTAPDWSVIAGPAGPQWVYKGWHMVYTREGDRPGSTAHDGENERTWNTLKFVPPVPVISAPANVVPLFAGGDYALADREGRVLYTGKCADACGDWTPLAAPMASTGFGEWSVSLAGDSAQWAWRGQPVFVSAGSDPLMVPKNGKVLRP